jgi:hypothetical protein
MPTERKHIRLILDAGTEHQVIDLARREGRSVSAMVNRLVTQQLAARRAEAAKQEELLQAGHDAKVSRIVQLIRGESSDYEAAQ